MPNMSRCAPTVTRFPVRIVTDLRDRCRKVGSEAVNDGPEGFCRSDFDANGLVGVFAPVLGLRAGHILLTYMFRERSNGNGMVRAFSVADPRVAGVLAAGVGSELNRVPGPDDGALDPMAMIDGDGSDLSYLSASILSRELREVGARWHGIRWGVQSVVGPTEDAVEKPVGAEDVDVVAEQWLAGLSWEATGQRLADIGPRVERRGRSVVVVLHIATSLGGEALYRVEDSFAEGSYAAESETTLLATGGAGFVS